MQRGPGARVILAVFGLQASVVVAEQAERFVGLALVEQGLGGGHGQDAGIRLPAGERAERTASMLPSPNGRAAGSCPRADGRIIVAARKSAQEACVVAVVFVDPTGYDESGDSFGACPM